MDPELYTESDITQLIQFYRVNRVKWLAEEAAGARKPSKSSGSKGTKSPKVPSTPQAGKPEYANLSVEGLDL
jgi:hypothetical protein